MSADDDWLNIDSLVAKIEREVVESNPKYQALVKAFEPLSPSQKDYVRALPAAHYVPAHALKALEAAGMKISERTVYRWQTDPAVKQAVACYRELASDFAGIDALSVMLRVSAWAEYCFEEVELFSRDGKPLGRGKRDAVNGLKALELLGRHTRAVGPESAATHITNNGPTQFVYKIISSKEGASPNRIEGEVIDAEVIEVKDNE